MEQSLPAIRAELAAEEHAGPLGLDEYQELSRKTEKISSSDGNTGNLLLLGLCGEIGSLLSELKKKNRDENAYFAYADSALEELGDVLWYLAGVARKHGFSLSALANAQFGGVRDGSAVSA